MVLIKDGPVSCNFGWGVGERQRDIKEPGIGIIKPFTRFPNNQGALYERVKKLAAENLQDVFEDFSGLIGAVNTIEVILLFIIPD